MDGGKDQQGLGDLLKLVQGWSTTVIALITAVAGIFVLFGSGKEVAFLSVAAVGAGALWLIFLYIYRKNRSSDEEDIEQRKHRRRKKAGALAGLLVLPVAALLVIYFRYIFIPPSKCPPVTVTITKFTGDDDIDRRIRKALRFLLSEPKAQGIEIEAKYREFTISEQGGLRDWINAAKEFGNSREGKGNIVIWGQIESAHHPAIVDALVTIANRCDRTRDYMPIAPQTATNVLLDYFRVRLELTREAGSELNIDPQVIDFVRFVTGILLYEEGRLEEAANLLNTVKTQFAGLYEGQAWQELARSNDRIANLKRANQAYERCVGPGWVFQEADNDPGKQHKAIAVAAYINASNALLDLSNLERESTEAYLKSAFSGYRQAISLYDQLKPDENLNPSWGILARTNLAIAKVRLAAGEQQKLEWLHEAEQDFNRILESLDENKPADRQSWAMVKASLGSLCLELSRAEQDRTPRLDQAEDHIRKALAVLDKVYDCNKPGQSESAYDCALLKSNLGAAFTERALDESSRDEALKYLAAAEKKYKEAQELFSRDPACSAEMAEEMSKQGLVYTERARWFENDEAENLLQIAVKLSSKALEVCRGDLYPIESALISNDLAYAKRELGKRRSDLRLLQESFDLCDASLRILPYEYKYFRGNWAAAKRNLGDSLYVIGNISQKMGLINEATRAYRNATIAYRDALLVWTDNDAHYDWTRTQKALGDAEGALAAIAAQPGTH